MHRPSGRSGTRSPQARPSVLEGLRDPGPEVTGEWMVRLDEHGRRAEWGVDRAGLVAGIDLAGDEMHPLARREGHLDGVRVVLQHRRDEDRVTEEELDRKSTRLNSSH